MISHKEQRAKITLAHGLQNPIQFLIKTYQNKTSMRNQPGISRKTISFATTKENIVFILKTQTLTSIFYSNPQSPKILRTRAKTCLNFPPFPLVLRLSEPQSLLIFHVINFTSRWTSNVLLKYESLSYHSLYMYNFYNIPSSMLLIP